MLLKTNKKGFTLIEIIMVIVIIGILAVVAVPQFFSLAGDADQAAEDGTVGAVRAGIITYQASNLASGGASPGYPSVLDSEGAGDCTACFTTVLGQGGISNDWEAAGSDVYTGPGGGSYTYTPADGKFE